jgi:hypothetical protein
MAGYTPLPELERHDSGRIRWDVQLPDYAHYDEIGANMRTLNWVAVAAGFDSIRIGSFAGGTDRIMPQVNGYGGVGGEQGEATATGRTYKRRAKRQASEDSGPIRTSEFWSQTPDQMQPLVELMTPSYASGTLKINTDVIAQSLSGNRELHQPKAWARELNSAVAHASRRAAHHNLLTPYGVAGFAVAEYFAVNASNVFRHSPEYYAAALAISNAGIALVAYTAGSIAYRPKDFLQTRWSLIYGAQLDRLAFVYGATAAKRLIKPIK